MKLALLEMASRQVEVLASGPWSGWRCFEAEGLVTVWPTWILEVVEVAYQTGSRETPSRSLNL